MKKLPQSLAGTDPALCALRGRTGEDGATPPKPLPLASPPSKPMKKLPQSLAGTDPALCALRGRTGEDGATPPKPLPLASPPSGVCIKDAMPGLWIGRPTWCVSTVDPHHQSPQHRPMAE